jgi:hypothetical protein
VRDTLQVLLRSISEGDRSNIVGFGSSTVRLFEEPSVPYDDQSLDIASQHVQSMRADLGSSHLHLSPPLSRWHTLLVALITLLPMQEAPRY